jgi:hypothetical protein
MINADFFGDVNNLKKSWEERSRILLEKWEACPTGLNKRRLKALGILNSKPRIADLEKRVDFKYYILTQKIEHLEIAKTSIEIDQILMEASVGKTIKIPMNSLYWMVEEECLLWQRQSLVAPLADDGFKRYMKVFAAFCKKYGKENPVSGDEDISDIPIYTLEELKVARDMLAVKQGLTSEEEKEVNEIEQMLLF